MLIKLDQKARLAFAPVTLNNPFYQSRLDAFAERSDLERAPRPQPTNLSRVGNSEGSAARQACLRYDDVGGGKGVQQSNQIRKEVNSHREGHHEYRTPLRYITGRKTPRNNSSEAKQNKIAHVITVQLH